MCTKVSVLDFTLGCVNVAFSFITLFYKAYLCSTRKNEQIYEEILKYKIMRYICIKDNKHIINMNIKE